MRGSQEILQRNTSMAAIVSHPLRARCWAILAERTASPREIAEALDEKLPNVAHHVRLLRDANVIELVKEEPRRGATEHWYRSVQRPMILNEDPDDRTQAERTVFAQAICQHSFAEATVALEAGTFTAREDQMMARVPMTIDEDGWDELTELFEETLRRTMAIEEASAKRAAERDGGPAPTAKVRALLATFEMPAN